MKLNMGPWLVILFLPHLCRMCWWVEYHSDVWCQRLWCSQYCWLFATEWAQWMLNVALIFWEREKMIKSRKFISWKVKTIKYSKFQTRAYLKGLKMMTKILIYLEDLKEAWKGIWKEFESTHPSPVNSNVKSAIDCRKIQDQERSFIRIINKTLLDFFLHFLKNWI